jgi:hypothetical protein
MTLLEYVKMRRQLAQVDSKLVAEAEALAREVGSMPTIDMQWDALEKKAEEIESNRSKSTS